MEIMPNYYSCVNIKYVKNTKNRLVQGVSEDPAGFQLGTFHST